jgi:ketosteroid isomerase-like protein
MERQRRARRQDRLGSDVLRAPRGPRSRGAAGVGGRRDTGRAMSQENVEVVRRAYAALGAYPAWFQRSSLAEFVATDIEVDLSALYPDAPIIRGLGAGQELTDFLPWGRSLKLEPERFFDVDDERVLVFVRGTAHGAGSGAPVELKDAHLLTVRDAREGVPRPDRRPRSRGPAGVANPQAPGGILALP